MHGAVRLPAWFNIVLTIALGRASYMRLALASPSHAAGSRHLVSLKERDLRDLMRRHLTR